MISFEEANSTFVYNHDSGILTWKIAVSNVSAGSVAGTVRKTGYVAVKLRGKLILAHRLAWLLFYECGPPKIIDHANRNKSDNRIVNLRAAESYQNSANSCHRGSKTGIRGIAYQKRDNRWIAKISCRGKRVSIGAYRTKEEAGAAYASAAKLLHGAFASDDAKMVLMEVPKGTP